MVPMRIETIALKLGLGGREGGRRIVRRYAYRNTHDTERKQKLD